MFLKNGGLITVIIVGSSSYLMQGKSSQGSSSPVPSYQLRSYESKFPWRNPMNILLHVKNQWKMQKTAPTIKSFLILYKHLTPPKYGWFLSDVAVFQKPLDPTSAAQSYRICDLSNFLTETLHFTSNWSVGLHLEQKTAQFLLPLLQSQDSPTLENMLHIIDSFNLVKRWFSHKTSRRQMSTTNLALLHYNHCSLQ